MLLLARTASYAFLALMGAVLLWGTIHFGTNGEDYRFGFEAGGFFYRTDAHYIAALVIQWTVIIIDTALLIRFFHRPWSLFIPPVSAIALVLLFTP